MSDKSKFRVFENKVLNIIYGSIKDEDISKENGDKDVMINYWILEL